MMAERDSVQHSQLQYAAELLKGRDGDCLQQLMTRTQYPRDETRLLQFYARSYSLTAFLVQQGGHRRLVQFLRDAADHDWESALLQHYEYADLVTVQTAWVDWTNRQAAAEQVAVAESDTTH